MQEKKAGIKIKNKHKKKLSAKSDYLNLCRFSLPFFSSLSSSSSLLLGIVYSLTPVELDITSLASSPPTPFPLLTPFPRPLVPLLGPPFLGLVLGLVSPTLSSSSSSTTQVTPSDLATS